jgi:5-methylcytosine-specific restriction endonuclease McrA
MTRRRISVTERMSIYLDAHGICHLCGLKIGLAERWDIEHVIPLALGGDETRGSPNLQPAHASCHRTKSATDAWNLAKAKRREANHIGARVPSRLSHPTLKRTVSGKVVPRD